MKKIVIIVLLLLFAMSAEARDIIVSGIVRDSKGDPVAGAVISLKGSASVGTQTGLDGKYSLSVREDGTLEASCLGFKTASARIGKDAVLNFTLEEDAEILEDAIVVGYGSMRRSDVTGAVMSVRIDEDAATKSATFDQLLEGRAAGVQVLSDNSNPDSGVSIRIRGLNTFSGHSEPLYVVDGVIIEGESTSVDIFSSAFGENVTRERESTNALAGINPQDIASIEILKDASATAIYGSQAANGVVLITTKSAEKDRPSINFNAGVSVGTAGKRGSILSFDEYAEMVRRYNTSGSYKKILFTDPVACEGIKVQPADWEDYVFRNSISQRYYFSIAGKPQKTNYFFSLGYNSTQGILNLTDSDAITSRVNLIRNIYPKLKLSFKTSFGYTKSNLVNGANNSGSSKNYNSVIASLFCIPFLADDDELSEVISDANERRGPIKIAEGNTNISERIRVTPSIVADWKINRWLAFRSTIGADVTYSEGWKSKDEVVSMGNGNIGGRSESFGVSFNWDNIFLFNFKKGSHSLSGTAGQSASKKTRSFNAISAMQLPQRYARGADINEALTENSYYSSYGETVSSLLSFFGRAVYNYADRYILTATMRLDGSSKFKGANKWGFFPSLAFAWRITSEPWFNVHGISNAKLRLGWGQIGNQNIGSYLTETVYSTDYGSSHYDTGKILGIFGSNIANADLKWETTTQENLGLDLGLFGGRFTLTVDAYNKDTFDLLQSKSVAYSTGFTKLYVNDGHIRNNGLEMTLETIPIKSGRFETMIGANLGINRNKVVNVGAMGDSAMLFLDDRSEAVQRNFFYGDKIFNSAVTAPVNIFIEGQPMGLFYGYRTDGIVQKGETVTAFSADTYREEGLIKFKDLNGNGFIDDGDRCVIGNPHPAFSYGFNLSISYSNFSARADFSGAHGFDIANMNNVNGFHTNLSKNCFRDAFFNAWTEDNPNNEWPKFAAPVDDLFCDRYIEDGSYLRLSNVSVSYSLKFKKTSKVLRSIVFTGSIGNLAIWTSYSGYNPTVNSFGDDIRKMGVDLNSSPYARTFNFDVKFRF